MATHHCTFLDDQLGTSTVRDDHLAPITWALSVSLSRWLPFEFQKLPTLKSLDTLLAASLSLSLTLALLSLFLAISNHEDCLPTTEGTRREILEISTRRAAPTLLPLIRSRLPVPPMEAFFDAWIAGLEELQNELLSAPRDNPDVLRSLVARAFAHYQDYYHQKARLAARDVLRVFSPSWLTPFERSFLWIAGWKPSLAFRLLRSLDDDDDDDEGAALSPEQRLAVAALHRETAAVERVLSGDMALAQEAMALPQVLAAARGVRNGQVRAEAGEMVVRSLELLLPSADALRARTVTRLVDILTPAQMVYFLLAATQLRLRIHRWGIRRDGRSSD